MSVVDCPAAACLAWFVPGACHLQKKTEPQVSGFISVQRSTAARHNRMRYILASQMTGKSDYCIVPGNVSPAAKQQIC